MVSPKLNLQVLAAELQ